MARMSYNTKLINRLHRVQMRMILDFMGIPVRDQDDSVKKMKMMLESLASKQPDDFVKYYQLVVDHKMPETPTQATGAELLGTIEEERLRVQRVLSDHMKYLEQEYLLSATDTLDKKAKELSGGFLNQARAEIEAAKKQFVTIQVKVGNKKAVQIKGAVPKQFKKLVQLGQQRKNILMVGPSGCGKTYISKVLSQALELPFAAQSCSVGVSESNFIGWLLPNGPGGSFNHVVSVFIKLYENGGVFLFDELDNADPNLLVFMNMALANDEFYLPQRFENPVVKRHPDFVAVAAANTFGGGADVLYSGRSKLDAATLDRFRMGTIQMDYDDAVEEQIIQNRLVLEWGRGIRKIINRHSFAKLMSTRAMVDAQEMIECQDWTLKDCNESYFADWSPEERAIIKNELDQLRDELTKQMNGEAA